MHQSIYLLLKFCCVWVLVFFWRRWLFFISRCCQGASKEPFVLVFLRLRFISISLFISVDNVTRIWVALFAAWIIRSHSSNFSWNQKTGTSISQKMSFYLTTISHLLWKILTPKPHFELKSFSWLGQSQNTFLSLAACIVAESFDKADNIG